MIRVKAVVKWCEPKRRCPAEMVAQLLPFDVELSNDTLCTGEWWNGRRAISMAASYDGVTHCLILEDDLLLCADFCDAVLGAIETRPTSIIQLFCGSHVKFPNALDGASQKARELGLTWVDQDRDMFGLGIVLPIDFAKHYLEWEQKNVTNDSGTDHKIHLWALCNKQRIAVTVPSLVDHDPSFDSTLGSDHNSLRRAFQFAGDNPPSYWTEDGYQDHSGDVRPKLAGYRASFQYNAPALKEWHLAD